MAEPLTKKQQAIYDFIVGHLRDNGRTPTFREISTHFGFASSNASYSQTKAIAAKGYLSIDKNIARGIRLTNNGICPTCGRGEAPKA